MREPRASRPHMPGYGVVGPDEGRGLLPWSWAVHHLEASRDYWIATVWPDGRPHVVPVWGIWRDGALVFSCSRSSRKARNLAADPRCVVTTSDPLEPVVVDGVASEVTELEEIERFAVAINRKHGVDYAVDFYTDPGNLCLRVDPVQAIGLVEADFTGSPTRWTFASS
jgi:pyridoxamine 5'-phosphate oxidase-like protein